MLSLLKRLWNDRRGNALIIAGAALPLLVGAAGLATDTIQWTTWKRQLQRTADSAAMAGAYARVGGKTVDSCANWSTATYDQPVGFDVKTNNHLGFTGATCSAQNSPTSGAFTADSNAVRVTLAVQRKLGFSSLFMSAAPKIEASATATVVPSGKYCVVSLESNAETGITATGATDVDLGCGMITNSTSMSAAVATGSAEVTASPIAAVGGVPASTRWGAGTVLQPFTLAQADPFADVVVPTPSGCTNFPNVKNGEVLDLSAQTGTVCFKSAMDPKGELILGAATYVLDGANLSLTNTGSKISCNGCTIIFTSSTAATNPASIGHPDVNGGILDLTSPADGPYKGLMMYQDRRAVADNNITINGNNGSSLEGAFYFPRADFTFSGNSGLDAACLQIVSKKVQFTGSSTITNTCPPGSGAGSFAGRKVRLVE
jgi:Flp pilus assembly protein TadG